RGTAAPPRSGSPSRTARPSDAPGSPRPPGCGSTAPWTTRGPSPCPGPTGRAPDPAGPDPTVRGSVRRGYDQRPAVGRDRGRQGAGTAEVGVDRGGGRPALRDRPHDERGTPVGVAGDEHPVGRGLPVRA